MTLGSYSEYHDCVVLARQRKDNFAAYTLNNIGREGRVSHLEKMLEDALKWDYPLGNIILVLDLLMHSIQDIEVQDLLEPDTWGHRLKRNASEEVDTALAIAATKCGNRACEMLNTTFRRKDDEPETYEEVRAALLEHVFRGWCKTMDRDEEENFAGMLLFVHLREPESIQSLEERMRKWGAPSVDRLLRLLGCIDGMRFQSDFMVRFFAKSFAYHASSEDLARVGRVMS